ncbi:keto-deoxy-phosphogluconate aldolase [Leptolyngbya valderiana BDU 20041]|nr:keto-deoxy-phosphogluconate aldolase [Leptolyngbya valderiana BDU 20041]
MTDAPDLALLDRLMTRAPVIPVLTLDDPGRAVDLARTLVDAGLDVLEVTLRTDQALAAIRRIADEVPEALVGAGTCIAPSDLDRVADAGGQFAISPGLTPPLCERALGIGLPLLPGVATASEVMTGLALGWERFKLFPAKACGGVALLRSFSGPFPGVCFCPTGGIGAQDFRDFLALPNVTCVGGSWMVPADRLAASDWVSIGRLARACLDPPA